MQGFVQYSPTEIVFGKHTEQEAGRMVHKWGGHKVLLVYGQNSVIKSGLIERVKTALAAEDIDYCDLSGVQPNPRLSLAEAGVKKALGEGVDFVLALGGGSAIDTAKAIAHGVVSPEQKLWDIWTGKTVLKKTLPVGVILTISAAGSETSDSAVLTNDELGKKAGLNTDYNRPVFAIMNPELTYTLPKYQIACGAVDIMMHTLERYFIPGPTNQMTDEIAEGLLRTVIKNGSIAYHNPLDYDAMSELMWCGSLSHNNLTGLGRSGKDFSVHKLGHALGGRFDQAHGATLSAVWGSWARFVYREDLERFRHYGETVWGLQETDPETAAIAAINHTVAYFKSLDMPVCLQDLLGAAQADQTLRELSMDATMNDTIKLSAIKKLGAEDVYEIFKAANSRNE